MIKQIDIDRAEILVRLSNSKSKKDPSEKLKAQIEDLIEIAVDKFEERATYQIFNRSELPKRSYFEGANKVALGLCTIGDPLPDLSRKYMKEGRLSDGVILDAIGSVVVDQIADIKNDEINEDAKLMGLVPSWRYSPGYCDMDVKDQDIIFDRIDNIGITLLPSKMMHPIKSVSFAVNLGEKFINRCITCPKKKTCEYRR